LAGVGFVLSAMLGLVWLGGRAEVWLRLAFPDWVRLSEMALALGSSFWSRIEALGSSFWSWIEALGSSFWSWIEALGSFGREWGMLGFAFSPARWSSSIGS